MNNNPFTLAKSKDEFRLIMAAASVEGDLSMDQAQEMLDMYRLLPEVSK